jgi:hypothetical protein
MNKPLTVDEAARIDGMGAVSPHSWAATITAQRQGAVVILDRHAVLAQQAAAAKHARRAKRGR